jgi:hypothetical protein
MEEITLSWEGREGREGGAGDVKKIGLKPKNVKGKKIESIIELSVHLKCL